MSTCTNCGYTHAISPELSAEHRSPMASIAGARAKLETATQDLFRLSGNSIPVDAGSLAPPRKPEPPPQPQPAASGPSEASIIFSLEELMKTSTPASTAKPQDDEPDQLWSMQAATPLFGTAQDLALLTAPAEPAKTSTLDSMTLESVRPVVRRWLPLGLGLAGAGLLAATALAFWPGSGSAEASSEPAAAELAPADEPAEAAEPPAEPAAEAPAAPAEAPPAVAADAPAAEAAPPDAPAEGEAAAADDAEADEDEADEDEASSSKPSSRKSKSTAKKKTAARKVAAPSKKAFDVGAAKRALSSAAAKAASCRTGGAGGSGKVQLTFAPSGKVSSAQIVGGSLSKAASSCALRHFRAARVPAFSGSAQTVAKSFKIP